MLPILLNRATEKRRNLADRIHALTAGIRNHDKKLTRLYDLIAGDTINDDPSLQSHIRKLQNERNSLVKQRTLLENEKNGTLKTLPRETIDRFADALKTRLRHPTDRAFAKAWLRSIVTRIDVQKSKSGTGTLKLTGPKSAIFKQAIAFDASNSDRRAHV